MHKKAHLPRTSRVNEKIMEYYMKFGQDRDLEKFMRLYSPSGCRSRSRSHSTTTATSATASSNASDDDGQVMRRIFLQETEISTEFTKASSSSATIARPVERQIPIRLECDVDGVETSNIENEIPSSQDVLTTPARTPQTECKHTQTPESIVKSHKRLEWDSLGDVGYKKSMSASNISILERSVLKEFFEESGRMATNVSEGDLKQLQMELQHKQVYRKSAGSAERRHCKYNTPPLASSTMMCAVTTKQASGGARPKQTSQNTSTSLQKKFEKCVQTSLQRPLPTTSREIQVTLSSASTTSSALGGSATPSSFDYISSRSSRSQSTAASTDGAVASDKGPANQSRVPKHAQQEQNQPHPFVTSISEMLARRKVFGEHNDRVRAPQSSGDATDLQQLHDTLKQALTENKENSATSTLLHSPQLDLGIQLLCSLIDARSLDQKEKKKLVRDIVKRISRMNLCGERETSRLPGGALRQTPSSNSVASKESGITLRDNNAQTTLTSKSSVTLARTRYNVSMNALDMQALERNLPSTVNSVATGNVTNNSANNDRLENIAVLQRTSPPTTSAKALRKLATLKAATKKEQQTSRRIAAGSTHGQDLSKLANRDSENAAGSIGNTMLNDASKDRTQPSVQCAGPACSINSESPSSSSKDLITQKAAHAANRSDTDTDMAAQSTMREWLNPMTQSEIEYEEKKREFAKHAAKREKLLKRMNGDKTDAERETQLQWIEKEIERLESLRKLLVKPDTQSNSVGTEDQAAEQVSNIPEMYDTVSSDKPPESLSETSERLVQEIEVVIEESNEDYVDLPEKLKRSKQRKRETQTVYEKSNAPAAADYGNLLQGKPRFRTVTETIITNEEQVSPSPAVEKQTSSDALIPQAPPPPPPPPPPPIPPSRALPQQRSKMKTPSDSNDSESIGSFVQQRKREFLEQYRDRKRNHYESMLQQQQQLLIQQQQQIIQQLQLRPLQPPTINGHYSVPSTMPRSYQPIPTQPYHQPYFPHYNQPPAPRPAATTMPPKPLPTEIPQQSQTSKRYEKKHVTVHATYTSSAGPISEQQPEQGTSSSSMFCMSSEVSVPMGTNDSTSSTPTTHQYDDVACGVASTKGVQTGSSLRGYPLLLGKRLGCSCGVLPQRHFYNQAPVSCGQSMCMQVKPKAIAYIIQFDKSSTGNDDSSSREAVAVRSNEVTSSTDNANNAEIRGNEITSVTSEPEPESEPRPETEPVLTLQDHLQRARPEFLMHSKERKAILNEIQAMRQERERELRDIVDNASISSLDKRLQRLPPPPTKRLRVFSTKVMKAMTNKYVEKLPEVVLKQEREREERRRRGNRLLRDVFNRRLQKRVRSGKLSINHSRQVI